MATVIDTNPTRTAFLASIADDPADHTRQLAFADWLDEHDEYERAELVRLRVEIATTPRTITYSRGAEFSGFVDTTYLNPKYDTIISRSRELESRLSAWPCERCGGNGRDKYTPRSDVCRDCGGSGDVLRAPVDRHNTYASTGDTFPLTWRGGYVAGVTVPRLADVLQAVEVRENVVEDVGGVFSYDAATTWQPTPRLLALCGTPPWAIPLEAVMAGDREPTQSRSYAPGGAVCFDWRVDTGEQYCRVPRPLIELMREFGGKSCEGGDEYQEFPTPDAAKLALGKSIVAFGRKTAGVTPALTRSGT
jgi:uncharacterized protein (TIGR02996 family)